MISRIEKKVAWKKKSINYINYIIMKEIHTWVK